MSQRFVSLENPFAGLHLLQRLKLGDERGYLSRLFCADELTAFGWRKPVAQINETQTRDRGTLRGLHFQHPPHGEMKLVTCLQGAVFDVALDLRVGSETFGKTYTCRLTAENGTALLLPEGFAHGFQTLCDDVVMLYVHSAAHSPEHEDGVDALDPALAIAWPLSVTARSTRDLTLPPLAAHAAGISP